MKRIGFLLGFASPTSGLCHHDERRLADSTRPLGFFCHGDFGRQGAGRAGRLRLFMKAGVEMDRPTPCCQQQGPSSAAVLEGSRLLGLGLHRIA
jgi:hypothetical protein